MNPLLVTLLTYSSLTQQWGWLGPDAKKSLEKKCQVQIEFRNVADSAVMLAQSDSRNIKSESIQGLIGVDYLHFKRWRKRGELLDLPEIASANLKDGIPVDQNFYPFDYGYQTWMVNLETLKKNNLTLPKSWKDLLTPQWRSQWIAQNPKLSSNGQGFLVGAMRAWSSAGSMDWVKSARLQWAALSPSWDLAYTQFTEGRVPLVWSYLTSQAYHRKHMEFQYQALVMDSILVPQLEGMVWFKSKNPAMNQASRCIAMELLGQSMQQKLPETQWMFSVRRDVKSPESFEGISQYDTVTNRNFEKNTQDLPSWLSSFEKTLRSL